MRYFLTILLIAPLFSQDVTLTQKEMINIANNIKELQADSARIANSLSICEELVSKMEEQAKVDSLLLDAKDKQINLLKTRDEMNEKLVELVKPKWYESQYLWLGIGFILGKI
jgi:hypothetical protein|tara:strand:- start:1325 stop:1663 length:339 start_codon:yes stop_codon:yes gene_type:complete